MAQGDELLVQGRVADAIASFRMAMHQDTLNPKVYARLSRAYSAQNKKVAADRYLRRAMNITYVEGIRALEAGDDSTAIISFENTLDIFPRHALALNKLGDILHARGQDQEALLYFEKAAEANPGFAATFVKLGQAYADLYQTKKAKEAFGKAIELNINALKAYMGLGQLYLDERAWAIAIEQFDKALLINPYSPAAHVGLAKAQSNLNNL